MKGKKILLPLFILLLAAGFYFIWYPPQKIILKKQGKNNSAILKRPVTNINDKPVLSKEIKYLSRSNSIIITLNDRFSFLPFHPIKLRVLDNQVFFLDKGKLYHLDLNLKYSTPIKIKQSNSKEFVDLAIESKANTVFLLDKLNNIYSYNIKTRVLRNIFKTKASSMQPDPQFVSIFFQKALYILDTARNQVFFQKGLNQFNPLFTLVIMPKKPEARDLTNGIAIYKENAETYILKRPDIVDVYSNINFKKRIKINDENQYGYLGFYSESFLNNLYISGGYNGSILAVSKSTGEIKGRYVIVLNKKKLPVYDIYISNHTMFILAGNYLLVHKNFIEDDFEKTYSEVTGEDLLFKSIDNPDIWDFKIPLKIQNISLPEHPSMYPGARRLYRYGIHEGIDFFSDPANNISIDDKTPVIAAQDGMVIKADRNYKEMSIREHEKVLKQCELNFETSPENANKLRGRQVRILHNGNLVTVYAHLSKIAENIKENTYVHQGELIGYVGNSGTSDGVYKTGKNLHLHFEIHIDDQSAELEYYLGKFLTIEETMQIYKRILH